MASLGFKRTIFILPNQSENVNPCSAFRTLDKPVKAVIIKPQGHHDMRRPGSNCWYQDKPRNRHLAEWRFRHVMRMVTVKPRIWNVIVTGIYIPPFGRQNRLSLCWSLRGSNEPKLFYQTSRKKSIYRSSFRPLDKSKASGIIKIPKAPRQAVLPLGCEGN